MSQQEINQDVLAYLEAKVDNALRLCYNDTRLKTVDVLLDLKSELRCLREMTTSIAPVPQER